VVVLCVDFFAVVEVVIKLECRVLMAGYQNLLVGVGYLSDSRNYESLGHGTLVKIVLLS